MSNESRRILRRQSSGGAYVTDMRDRFAVAIAQATVMSAWKNENALHYAETVYDLADAFARVAAERRAGAELKELSDE